MRISATRLLSLLSLVCVLGCALVYLVALGTKWGLHVDAHALPRGASGPDWTRAHAALRHAVDTIHVGTILLGAAAAALVAVRRRRMDLAAVAVATLAGANLTTYVLKPLLGRADPFGGNAARSLDAVFPSGHATAAMSLALVAVIVAPRRWRGWVAVLASGYAACVGVGLVLIAAHYPSDVAAGYLVATAWAAAMAALALGLREQGAPAPSPLRLPSLGAILTVALFVLGGAALLLEPAAHLRHGLFAVSAVVIAGLALLLPLGLTLVLDRERRPRSIRR